MDKEARARYRTAMELGKSRPDLAVIDTMTIETRDGSHTIELLFGDITKLSREDKVDLVMVSAFQGDYIPVRNTVIGALHHILGLSVHELASDKQEDLRRTFHCWISKPLPEQMPYKQLLCFETPFNRTFRHPAELVADVFRALVPFFGNEDKSVITPILSTGNQAFSKRRMVRAMLEAAVNWIRAGLPLRRLKIVVYGHPARIVGEDKDVVSIFQEMKKTFEKVETKPEAQEISHDIYLSYHREDTRDVEYIISLMASEKTDFRIYTDQQEINAEAVFQDSIYKTMIKCRRIVTFLSPKFLESADCLEKFNLGMVCNRSIKKNLLVPFLIDTICNMPTYMQMMQYIDCRYREGEARKLKMLSGLSAFVTSFRLDVRYSLLKPVSDNYDVFISYSHKNSSIAQVFLTQLLQLQPELNIFFDRIELKAGSSWQQTLYNAMDNTTVVLALLSPEYFASVICQEEYNLALAKHLSNAHELDLVPVLVEPMAEVSRSHSKVEIIDGTSEMTQVAERVCRAAVNFINTGTRDPDIFTAVEKPVDLDEVLSAARAQWFNHTYDIVNHEIKHKTVNVESKYKPRPLDGLTVHDILRAERNNPILAPMSSNEQEELLAEAPERAEARQLALKNETLKESYDVGFICADYKYGLYLDTFLHYRYPEIVTNFDVKSPQNQLDSLDRSKIVVALVSPNLVHSSKETDEFHIALARQRAGNGRTILYPIHLMALPKWPTYFHIVRCNIALNDICWKNMVLRNQKQFVDKMSCEASQAERTMHDAGEHITTDMVLALSAAGDDIISLLQNDTETGRKDPCIRNVVRLGLECSKLKNKIDELIPIEKLLRKLELNGLSEKQTEGASTREGQGIPQTTAPTKDDEQTDKKDTGTESPTSNPQSTSGEHAFLGTVDLTAEVKSSPVGASRDDALVNTSGEVPLGDKSDSEACTSDGISEKESVKPKRNSAACILL